MMAPKFQLGLKILILALAFDYGFQLVVCLYVLSYLVVIISLQKTPFASPQPLWFEQVGLCLNS